MKFSVGTIILINNITALWLFEYIISPLISTFIPRNFSNSIFKETNCQDRNLIFIDGECIKNKLREIQIFKKEIKKVELIFISQENILKILEECALHLENPIKLEIQSFKSSCINLPTISDSFNNLKISSLHLRGYDLHPTLKKAIFKLIVKNKTINSLEFSVFNIDSLIMNDIISILKNQDVDMDLLFFDHVNIKENELTSLFDTISTIEGPRLAFNDLLMDIYQIKNQIINVLESGSIIPNLSFNQPYFGKYRWNFNVFSSNNGSKIILSCNNAEYEDCINYLDAILKNTKLNITEIDIQFKDYKKIISATFVENIANFSEKFSEIFKKLCSRNIYLTINGWLNEEQEKIMQEIKLENIKRQELSNNEKQEVETAI